MNVLFYTDTPNIGGAEKQMLMLARHLKQLGHTVSLAYGQYSKIRNLHDDFMRVCSEIYVLPVIHKHDPRHYQRLKTILKNVNFDLIHLHLWNPASCRYAFLAASYAKLPIIATEHDPFELNGLKKLLKIRALKKTDETIVVSNENARILSEYYGVDKCHINVVHNGIELERYLNASMAELPVPAGKIIATCIAEMHPRKGHKYLLRAFQKLALESPNIHLILVGTGPIEVELKEKFGDLPTIHFLGWRDDIPEILKASDMLILPSLKEAFGLVVLEAMASEVLAIATNHGGTVDIVDDGITGYLIPPASSEAIIYAIHKAIRNPDQKRDIEKAALLQVQQVFTAKKMTCNTIEVYRKVIS